MRRGLCLGLALACLVGVAAAAAYASARGGDLNKPMTIRVQITLCGQPGTDCASIDQPPSGASLGDEFVFNVPTTRHGHRVGAGVGNCVAISLAGNGTDECETTFTFNGGTVQVDGLFHLGGPGTRSTFAVTGGTGFFRNARGEVTNVVGTNANTAVFHLIP